MSSIISHKIGKLKGWHIALIALGVSGLSRLLWSGNNIVEETQREFYKTQEQAPWAPPGWVFGPAWTLNNFFILLALQRIINSNMPQRKKLLLLQAGIWAIFFSFELVYFKKGSTILASVWTQADAILALASMLLTWKRDRKLSLYYLPLTLWTWYASSVAHYQALKNEDLLFGTEPLIN